MSWASRCPLLTTSLTQIAVWAAAFVWCGSSRTPKSVLPFRGQLHDPRLRRYCHVRRWRYSGHWRRSNGSLMLGLSAAMLFAVMARVSGQRPLENRR